MRDLYCAFCLDLKNERVSWEELWSRTCMSAEYSGEVCCRYARGVYGGRSALKTNKGSF